MPARRVSIHYRRLPDRSTVFEQDLVAEEGGCSITLLSHATIPRPLVVADQTILEPGAPVVWFTFPGRWYDIGRFHLANETFTGFYANVLTPVRMEGDRWFTTDLCLDVWSGVDGSARLLDEAEFREALNRGWMDESTAAAARATAARLLRAARLRTWPSERIRSWTLARARAALSFAHSPSSST